MPRHRLEDETIEQINLDDLETVVLEPGDFLYVPPGTIHSTEALERSLSVMFNFAPPRFDALVELMVRRTLCAVAKWRGLPAGGPQGAHTEYVNDGLRRLRIRANHARSSARQAVRGRQLKPVHRVNTAGRNPTRIATFSYRKVLDSPDYGKNLVRCRGSAPGGKELGVCWLFASRGRL